MDHWKVSYCIKTGNNKNTLLSSSLLYGVLSAAGNWHKQVIFCQCLWVGGLIFKRHCHVYDLCVALYLAASPHGRRGLLEDTVVSCCEAGATYVCGKWFPWGNCLIGSGCWGPVAYLWTLPKSGYSKPTGKDISHGASYAWPSLLFLLTHLQLSRNCCTIVSWKNQWL